MKNQIIIVSAALSLAACSNEDVWKDSDKTPVSVAMAFVDRENSAKTRAVDHDFESGDKLVAYLRHAQTASGATEGVGSFDQTVTFTVNSDATMTQVGTTDTYETSDITPNKSLYWDDFSSATYDIRSAGHGLQSLWGYCYNGNASAPSTPADVLTWSAATDQTAGYKTSDLLWSKEQDVVAYEHSTAVDGTRSGLVIPYTHALSKATIVLVAATGFDGANIFNNTTVTLSSVNVTGTFTASTAQLGTDFTTGSIQMHKSSVSADGKTAVFDCLFVPTVLTEGNAWATVSNVDGNNYTISLTSDILTNWECTAADGTHSGVNYQLTATLKKQAIDIKAQITDWVTKEATAEGVIKFATDLSNINPSTDLTDGTSYDIFRGTSLTGLDKVTTREYADGVWTNNPEIYWQNASTDYYFRGLATLSADNKITTVGGSLEASKENDLLWATTAKHTGKNNSGATVTVNEGAAISPRTTQVPMQFHHAMSKVTVTLGTTTDDSAVDLTNATISIPGLIDKGTINVATGEITATTSSTSTLSALSGESHIVIPQNLAGKVMTITLQDGTTYSVTLTDVALDGTSTKIENWERGNAYNYTVKLSKEAILFGVFIKDWTVNKGSGDASLDWD